MTLYEFLSLYVFDISVPVFFWTFAGGVSELKGRITGIESDRLREFSDYYVIGFSVKPDFLNITCESPQIHKLKEKFYEK